MVHGGLITTVCDEAMAWACYSQKIWGMTARLMVRFRQPVHVGRSYRATGWVVSSRSRIIEVASAIHDGQSGLLVADATARFVKVSDEQSVAWVERYGSPDQE